MKKNLNEEISQIKSMMGKIMTESFHEDEMAVNTKLKNDYYFNKFLKHSEHFQQLADNLVGGASADDAVDSEVNWDKYLMNLKNKDYHFDSSVGVNITNDIYGRVLDYPFAEGESMDNAVGIAIVTFMKMGRSQDDIKIIKLMDICKKFYGNDEFKIFTTRKQPMGDI